MAAMDASAALERLRDISSQVQSAVVFERGGKVLASTFGDDGRAERAAEAATELLVEAERRRSQGEFAQLEVALQNGSVFVVRDGDRLVAATTPPDPTVGLVFYDLKSCLRELDTPAEPKKKPAAKRAPRKRTTTRKKTDAKS